MNDQDLDIVFDLMQSKIKHTGKGGNRSAQCPLAQWTHPKGRDENPSATVKAGDPALFRCWSCREQGSVRKIAKKYLEFSGDDRAYAYVREIEKSWSVSERVKRKKYGDDKKRVGQQIVRQARTKDQQGKLEDDFKKYMRKIPDYAFERGLTMAQCERWEIGYDPKEMRMIIPIRDKSGKLMGVSGRDLLGDRKPKYKHYYGLQKERVLYGENYLDRDKKRGYIVEGFFDVWQLEAAGLKNVLSPIWTSLSEDHLKKIDIWFNELVFFPDYDHFGVRFCEEFSIEVLKKCPHVQKVGIAGVEINKDYIKRIKPKDWVENDFRFKALSELDGKDPADLNFNQIQLALKTIKRVTLF